jgi:hypothetical protein
MRQQKLLHEILCTITYVPPRRKLGAEKKEKVFFEHTDAAAM